MKRISKFVSAILLMSVCAVMPTKAQNAGSQKYEYDFNPHWFIQLQGGAQYTLGEVEMKKLLSPNVQLSLGYEFTPVFATRLAINAWQSKAGIAGKWADLGDAGAPLYWKWTYVAPSIDFMFDMTNFLGGFNPERKYSIGVFGGIGANIPFNNDEAYDANRELRTRYYRLDPNEIQLALIWSDPFKKEETTQERGFSGMFRFGGYFDYHLNDNWSLGLEANANIVNDHYNSKKAANADWYFNLLGGIKYCFGQTYSKRPATDPLADALAALAAAKTAAPQQLPAERIIEKTIEKEVPYLYEEIYFTINKYNINKSEEYKVRHIADFLKQNPDAKVSITGHADSNTGTKSINQTLSEKRAAEVAKVLSEQYGISSSRISTDAKGDTANFYSGSNYELNRVCVCIGK